MQYTQLSRRSAGGKIDWEKQYLTFIPVLDAVFRWAGRSTSGHLEYSTDEGQTWTTISRNGNTPSIQAGTKVMWKGNLEPDASSYGGGGIGSFSSTGSYNVMGNTMSLLYGDNYIGQTTLVKSYTFYQLFLNNMVVDCKNMILPATSLTKHCYSSMFYGCTRLIAAPELPAKTLIDYCYSFMFWGCTSITTTPDLPATTLAAYCCQSMFNGCTSLTTVPSILPATVLAQYCYTAMFLSCTSLTTAPELPATTLASGCYNSMFDGCTKLNYIKALFTTEPSSSYTSDWVLNVAATGTFVKSTEATWTTIGVNGVPEGWTVKVEWEKQYLTFIPVTNTIFTWTQKSVSGHLEYSVNGGQTWVNIADGGSTPTITAGSKVIWRGDLKPNIESVHVGGIGTFSASGNYNAYGNTMSLLFYDNYYDKQLNSTEYDYAFFCLFNNDTHLLTAPILPSITLTTYCYYQMFMGCTSLTTAPELPATTLSDHCYASMFYGCTSLITAPELPATTLISGCYTEMFRGCSSLVTAPTLPATTLASSCYYQMFMGCKSLTTAPTLPATKLVSSCYFNMFRECKSLTTAPTLPATTLVKNCYARMFYGCSRLNYIKALFITKPSTSYTDIWVSGVAENGTFVKNSAAKWTIRGDNGIPLGWTVVTDNQ